MPVVSILLPVHNTAPYLKRCLDSLKNQTYQDLEIIMINDGSQDESLAICEHYAREDSRFSVYSYPQSGISRTRNRALDVASGEYVMFVDSDDYVELDMVRMMMEEMTIRELDIVQCGFVMDFGPVPFYRLSAGHKTFSTTEAMHAIAAESWLNNYPWGKLYKRSCFHNVRFPEDKSRFEDTCTIFKALANAHRVGTIPNRFYHYAQRMGSLTNCMDLETVYGMRQAYLYQKDMLKKLFPQEVFSFDQQLYNTDMVIIYTLILFCHRREDPKFIPADFDWKQLRFSPLLFVAYYAWLGIAVAKLSPRILKVKEEADQSASGSRPFFRRSFFRINHE